MQLITIQNEKVVDVLKHENVYHADMTRVPANRVAPYQKMCEYYGWGFCPIFACEVGKPAHFDGDWRNGVAVELNVPDEIARRQYYYDWCDVIYYTEFPAEFADSFDTAKIPNLEVYIQRVFDFVDQGSYSDVQATIPIIKREWITRVSHKPLAVVEGASADKVLRSLTEYDPEAAEFGTSLRTSVFNSI